VESPEYQALVMQLYARHLRRTTPFEIERSIREFQEIMVPLMDLGPAYFEMWSSDERAWARTTYIGPSANTLTYILAWDDLGARQQRWDAFQADPEWLAAKAESERDGPLLVQVQSFIMKPTEYSQMQ
jgi:hypothetical protein